MCRRHLIDYSSIYTVVGLPDVSVDSSFGFLSRMVEPIDQLSRFVGFCRFIDGESDKFSLNVLCEELSDHFIQIQQLLAKVVQNTSQLAGRLERSKLIP